MLNAGLRIGIRTVDYDDGSIRLGDRTLIHIDSSAGVNNAISEIGKVGLRRIAFVDDSLAGHVAAIHC